MNIKNVGMTTQTLSLSHPEFISGSNVQMLKRVQHDEEMS